MTNGKKPMKIIYLGAHTAEHPGYNIVYQDIDGTRDIGGDMLDVDLSEYDAIIATPPCNYWSKANHRRETSEYAQKTKHLLPAILDKCLESGKPFLVENVRNQTFFKEAGLLDLGCGVSLVGRHTYWTNVRVDLSKADQVKDNINYIHTTKRQGGANVASVVEIWLEAVTKG